MLASKVISSESRSLIPSTSEVLLMLCMIRCLETEQENQLLSMVRRGLPSSPSCHDIALVDFSVDSMHLVMRIFKTRLFDS